MSKFLFDTEDFVEDTLPPLKRTPRHLAWVKSPLSALGEVNSELENSFRPLIETQLKYTSQTIVFEKILSLKIGDNVEIVTLEPDTATFFVGEFSSDTALVAALSTQQTNFVGEFYDLEFTSFEVRVATATWNALTQPQKDEFNACIQKIKYAGTTYVIVLV